jgi:hypothetical protein
LKLLAPEIRDRQAIFVAGDHAQLNQLGSSTERGRWQRLLRHRNPRR